jgi:hypothetical protein
MLQIPLYTCGFYPNVVDRWASSDHHRQTCRRRGEWKEQHSCSTLWVCPEQHCITMPSLVVWRDLKGGVILSHILSRASSVDHRPTFCFYINSFFNLLDSWLDVCIDRRQLSSWRALRIEARGMWDEVCQMKRAWTLTHREGLLNHKSIPRVYSYRTRWRSGCTQYSIEQLCTPRHARLPPRGYIPSIYAADGDKRTLCAYFQPIAK